MKNPCKVLFWYHHDWHKSLYHEYRASIGDPISLSSRAAYIQLYGTKQCGRCGAWGEGFAEKDNPYYLTTSVV